MRFDASQQMRLSQQMKLAPRMIQSMEILQMPLMVLQERIEQELEENIALEQVETRPEQEEPAHEDADERTADRLEQRELVVGDDARNRGDDWERLSTFESSYGDATENEYSSSHYRPRQASGERDQKLDAMANIAARGESLTEQLLHQWTFAEVPEDIARAGEILIGYIDADGLLGADMETILEQNRDVPGLALTAELLERALDELQHWLDPPGLAARDKRECFLLQIDDLEANDEDPGHNWEDVRRLIKSHFEDLLQNRLPRIAEEADLSLERIQSAMALMRRLNLSPGRDLVHEEVPPVIPDVIVEHDEQANEYVARLSGGALPSLRVSSQYRKMARDRSQDKATREFVGNSVRNAQWLIESIAQRQSTLLRVVNVVLARQREYFDHGPQHLRPLPMVEVADQLGIHVGTVSRAVADKWMQTPRGLVPLRKFFSGGTATDSGRDMSWEAVKATLQEIIAAEDKTRPMSDEALAGELKQRGIDIARRTVVKYRQQLGIPPARRRKVFRAQA
ncbi:MAG: RNA polymerase factor sigma-54 [Planctomycetota bacterium]|nr:RNA polymerase factor sigma-54 [Planctomycetota bacterium]